MSRGSNVGGVVVGVVAVLVLRLLGRFVTVLRV